MAAIQLGPHQAGDGLPPVVIADIGLAHGGDPHALRELVEQAAQRCHAVKLQVHIPEAEMDRGTMPQLVWDAISSRTLTATQETVALAGFVTPRPFALMATPFSVEAVGRAVALGVDALKVGSGEVSCRPIIEACAATGLPVVLSTGLCTMAELEHAVDVLLRAGRQVAILHCVSLYPCPPEAARLSRIRELAGQFPECVIGYSDHTAGLGAPAAAMALGAKIVEVHVGTDDHNPDHECAKPWSHLRQLTRMAHEIYLATEPRHQVERAEHRARVSATRDWACHAEDGKRPLVRQ